MRFCCLVQRLSQRLENAIRALGLSHTDANESIGD